MKIIIIKVSKRKMINRMRQRTNLRKNKSRPLKRILILKRILNKTKNKMKMKRIQLLKMMKKYFLLVNVRLCMDRCRPPRPQAPATNAIRKNASNSLLMKIKLIITIVQMEAYIIQMLRNVGRVRMNSGAGLSSVELMVPPNAPLMRKISQFRKVKQRSIIHAPPARPLYQTANLASIKNRSATSASQIICFKILKIALTALQAVLSVVKRGIIVKSVIRGFGSIVVASALGMCRVTHSDLLMVKSSTGKYKTVKVVGLKLRVEWNTNFMGSGVRFVVIKLQMRLPMYFARVLDCRMAMRR